MLTNETVNIWSHLLGFLLFFSLGVNDVSSVLPASGANREDYVIYVIGLFCFQVKAVDIAGSLARSSRSCCCPQCPCSQKNNYLQRLSTCLIILPLCNYFLLLNPLQLFTVKSQLIQMCFT